MTMENRQEYTSNQSVNISYETAMTTYYQVSADQQHGPVTLHVGDTSLPIVSDLHGERPDVLALATATLLQGSYSDTPAYMPVQNLVLSQGSQFSQLGQLMETSLTQQSSQQDNIVQGQEGIIRTLTAHEELTEDHTTGNSGQSSHDNRISCQSQVLDSSVLHVQTSDDLHIPTSSSFIQLSTIQQVEPGIVFGSQQTNTSLTDSSVMLVKPTYPLDSMVVYLDSSTTCHETDTHYNQTPTFVEKKKRAARSKPPAKKKESQANAIDLKPKQIPTLPPDGIISPEDLKGMEMTSNTIIALMKKKFNKKGLKINECPYCKKGLSSREALRTHLRTHTGERPYQCEDCGKSFSDCSVFRRHQRIHTGEKPYVCDVCGRAFNQSTSLEAHKRTHTGTKKYTCEVCGLGFDKLQMLLDHCRSEKHGNIRMYKCTKCCVEVQDEAALKRHMCSHTGERAYACHICGAKWEKHYGLMEHLRMHAGIKPYSCPECEEKFVRKGDLRIHMSRHVTAKFTPHKCPICGEGFKQKAQLMVHKRIHTGIKPYDCKGCGKCFYSWKDLREHRRKHSGKRIYKCDCCNRTFAALNTLKVHIKMHMKNGPLSCSICLQIFSNTNDFISHTRFDHSVKTENSNNSESSDTDNCELPIKKTTTMVKEKMKTKNSYQLEKKCSSASEESSDDSRSEPDDEFSSSEQSGSDLDKDCLSPVFQDETNDSSHQCSEQPTENKVKTRDISKEANNEDNNKHLNKDSVIQSVCLLSNTDAGSATQNDVHVNYARNLTGIETLVRASVLSDATSTATTLQTEVSLSKPNCTDSSISLSLLETECTQTESAVDKHHVYSDRSAQLTLLGAYATSEQCASVSCSSNADIKHEYKKMDANQNSDYVQGSKGFQLNSNDITINPELDSVQHSSDTNNCSTLEKQVRIEAHVQHIFANNQQTVELSIKQPINGQQFASTNHENKKSLSADNKEVPAEANSDAPHLSEKNIHDCHSENLNSGNVLTVPEYSETLENDSQQQFCNEIKTMYYEASNTEENNSGETHILSLGRVSSTPEQSRLKANSESQAVTVSEQLVNCQDVGFLPFGKYLTAPSSNSSHGLETIYSSVSPIKDYANNLSLYGLQFTQGFAQSSSAAFITDSATHESKFSLDGGYNNIGYNQLNNASEFTNQHPGQSDNSRTVPTSIDYSINLQTLINTSLAQEEAKVVKDASQERHLEKRYSKKFCKNLECQYCGKGLSSIPALKNHEMIHTGERPYKCECGKSFIDSSTFKRHQRIHTGIKPYMCDVCGKQFNQSNSYRTHMTCHTGEKHYKCNVCGHSYDKLKKLMEHNQRENHGDLKQQTCSVCSAVFRDVSSLNRHMCSHTGEKAFKCEYCNKTYEKQYQFTEHLHSHAGFKPFKCNICGDSFLRKGQLKFHEYKHQYGRQFECDMCHQAFYRSTDLTVHKRIHTGEKPFKCDLCDKPFRQKWECKNHMLWDHSNKKPFTCEKCCKSFRKAYSLKVHMQNKHENDKKHRCFVCKKRFRKLENLKKHSKKHRSLNCRLCGKMFLTEKKTQQHMQKFHKDDKKVMKITKRKEKQKLECMDCGKKFCFKYDLEEHQRLHTGESIYKCTICSKIFSREYHLNIHTMKHTGEKRFKCDECGEPFASGKNLKMHRIEQHGASDADIFKCEICQHEFADRNTMKKHMKSHSKEKPYECKICGRHYQYSWNLKIHEKSTHTGDMPFKCKFCQKKFSHRRDYRHHVKSHTDDLPFKCSEPKCGRSFASQRALRMHEPAHSSKFIRHVVPSSQAGFSIPNVLEIDSINKTQQNTVAAESLLQNDCKLVYLVNNKDSAQNNKMETADMNLSCIQNETHIAVSDKSDGKQTGCVPLIQTTNFHHDHHLACSGSSCLSTDDIENTIENDLTKSVTESDKSLGTETCHNQASQSVITTSFSEIGFACGKENKTITDYQVSTESSCLSSVFLEGNPINYADAFHNHSNSLTSQAIKDQILFSDKTYGLPTSVTYSAVSVPYYDPQSVYPQSDDSHWNRLSELQSVYTSLYNVTDPANIRRCHTGSEEHEHQTVPDYRLKTAALEIDSDQREKGITADNSVDDSRASLKLQQGFEKYRYLINEQKSCLSSENKPSVVSSVSENHISIQTQSACSHSKHTACSLCQTSDITTVCTSQNASLISSTKNETYTFQNNIIFDRTIENSTSLKKSKFVQEHRLDSPSQATNHTPSEISGYLSREECSAETDRNLQELLPVDQNNLHHHQDENFNLQESATYILHSGIQDSHFQSQRENIDIHNNISENSAQMNLNVTKYKDLDEISSGKPALSAGGEIHLNMPSIDRTVTKVSDTNYYCYNWSRAAITASSYSLIDKDNTEQNADTIHLQTVTDSEKNGNST